MQTQSILKTIAIVVQLGLGILFVYGGIQKFTPKPKKPKTELSSKELPEHVVKIKAYIGGVKQTGYFWEVLGIVEILGGILLLTQGFALLGGFILLPVTLHIFLFHLFLEPHEIGELLLTALYLLGNLFIILRHYKTLQPIFLTFKLNTK